MALFPSPSLLLLLLFFHFLRGNAAKCHPDDEAGLLGFKSGITEDPSGILTSWKAGTDCCTWNGITCLVGNRVTALSLYAQTDNPNSYLTGSISPSLSKLRYLDGIYFHNLQNITGLFPKLLFNLPRLLFVYIENCKLYGRLPANIDRLSQLDALSLEGNLFSGPIPASISKLTHLTQLNLGGNLFSGQIPLGISQLKNLTMLRLDRSLLLGKIPDFFSSFPVLAILSLSYNGFSGEIPPSISALAPQLIYLELDHNKLTGKIPDFLGRFKALDTLNLSWNGFSGVVPKSFSNLTKIFNLDLSHNDLVDPFPEMYVKGIESLDLSYNHFHLGKIPTWVTSSSIIYSLKLAGCGLKFKLDDWKPSQTYFYDYIDISDNEISGSPVGLLNSTDYLVGFWAARNQLKFNMENLIFPKEQTLKYLDLSRNLISGKIPSSVSGLQKLNVSYNHLCGQIPASKFSAEAFFGNDCLCGSPLPACKI
ncbi:PREDICTED: DNA-damage-repair/toleration protein DRT100-like [Nelumbo nucifera]|uniref:Leucine-rich repeat-containing N-terminal plant-type domain-containing protein n=2 Tax=Nelumbo nucifera TaxID=4432 RepID=A0A822XJ59_NELNU|nr:PREDICTED: DNA-damage-repair/toleration protein DRT100-like [Nelumbo nucifera]DAD20297.1 TPA_asm: hypothetical protein HUJ06_021760 [Nelumbo nucifera]